jgi:hypothetical protein
MGNVIFAIFSIFGFVYKTIPLLSANCIISQTDEKFKRFALSSNDKKLRSIVGIQFKAIAF